MRRVTLIVFRLLAPLLVFQQIALPLTAYAQTQTVIVNKEDMQVKQQMDARARDNASGARRGIQGSAAPNLQYMLPPSGWVGHRPQSAAEQALDAQRAQDAANRFFPADAATTLNDAQRAHGVARQAVGVSGVLNYGDNDPVQKSRNSDARGFSYHELFPGYGTQEAERIINTFGQTYNNPESIKPHAEYTAKHRLLRNGCQRTDFELVEKLNVAAAFSDRAHRVLSVTFFDYVKTDIEPAPDATEPCILNGQPATCPAKPKERYDITPSTYQGESLKLSVALLGNASNSWTDFVSASRIVQYDYNPFRYGENLNYFPFNVRVLYRLGGAVFEAQNAVVSYGAPPDRWTPVIAWTPPLGTEQVVVVADVYKATHHFIDPEVYGNVCPPMPPVSCTQAADDGTIISWCPGTPSANVAVMFSSTAHPDLALKGRDTMVPMQGNLGRNESFLSDGSLRAGVLRGLRSSSSAAAQLAGACYRVPAGRASQFLATRSQKEVETCSRRLISAYEPNGCANMQRQFGVTQLAPHQFLQVRAWNKVKVPIPNTSPQQYTFQLQAANVTGPIDISQFPVMGSAQCNEACRNDPVNCDQNTCTHRPAADREGYYLEYIHTPFGESPRQFGVSAITVNGGSVSVSHFGRPSDGWKPTGSASGGNVSQVTFAAMIQMVTVNDITGCPLYLQMLRDGICRRPNLTCTDVRSSVTIGSLTFGPGMPTDGFVDLLKPWVESTATVPSYEENDNNTAGGGDAVIDNNPSNLGLPAMCWRASGPALLECGSIHESDTVTVEQTPDGSGSFRWASDCSGKLTAKDRLITSCPPLPSSCSDERMVGIYSGLCYDEVKAYDCSDQPTDPISVESEAFVDVCNGAMRCLGTQCHRPNLSGAHDASFAEAAGAMEALNHMKYDMNCAETGQPPTDVDQPCTLIVFAGKQMYCSYAVGFGKVMTAATLVDGNCCRETKKQAGPAPSWQRYMQVYYLTKKIAETETFKRIAAQAGLSDAYNSISSFFGQVRDTVLAPFQTLYKEAASFVSQNITTPISSALDGMFGAAGTGAAGAAPAAVGVDAAAKLPTAQGYFSNLTNAISQFKQQLLQYAHNFVAQISPELAGMMFTIQDGKVVGLSQSVQTAFTVWMIARLIVSIIFACRQVEYEWATNDKWRLCAYAGTCCGRRAPHLGCIQRRDLYCCYKSIVARVIATEIITKGLVPGRNGYERRKCRVNCSGFTVEQLGQVDWARVDMTEAIQAMIESGILNPNNPKARYGAYGNELSTPRTLGSADLPEIDRNTAGAKTAEHAIQNADAIIGFGVTIQGVQQCYDPSASEKMPFSYAHCEDQQ